jgi:uncharacterized membrane protein
MKKIHKFKLKFTLVLILLIVFMMIFYLFFVPNSNGDYIWNLSDYVRVTEVDYKAIVVDEPGSNGKVIITERLTFDIHAASQSNPFWELWRALPEKFVDGVKVEYKVNSVKQVFADGGAPVVFAESPQLYWYDNDYIDTAGGLGPGKWYHSEGPYDGEYNFECVLMYVDGLYRETVVFEIEYEMYNASLRYADSAELYLSLYDDKSIKYLESVKGQILFPNDKMPGKGNYDAYTYGTNSHDFPFEKSTTMNPGFTTFLFELQKSQLKFRPYNSYIEFALVAYGADKHIFTQYASINTYYNNNELAELQREQVKYEALPALFKTRKIIALVLCLAGTSIIIMLSFSVDKKIRKKHIFYQPAMQMDYFRDIPSDLDPSFAAALVFCKHKSYEKIEDGYAAVMLSLVRKGYIELDKIKNDWDWNSKNVKIIVRQRAIQPPELEILTPTEELYFNLILRHAKGVDISLSSFQKKLSADYENTNSFVENIDNAITNIGVSQGYLQKAEYKKQKKQAKGWALTLGIIGVLLITAGNIASYQTRLDLAFGGIFIFSIGFLAAAIHINRLSKKYILLTQFGEDEYAKWRGLYNFLNSETLMKERTVVELVIWEKYLIYATACGISEKVIKALKVCCPNANESPMLSSNSYYLTRSFRSGISSFGTATRTASYAASSGGHGGYGGGGRGGGGGGGGH